MKKRLLSILLALVMCLSLLPVTALAAEQNLPDWYFLFAIFKNVDADCADGNGKMQHVTYSMPQEEVALNRVLAVEFEEYMNSLGVMRAHVEAVEIDTTVTELKKSDDGTSIFMPEQAAPFLKDKVDLDRYDHVFCILDLDIWTGYGGMSYYPPFENGTGMSQIHHQNWMCLQDAYRSNTNQNLWHMQIYVHEFLHFMEQLNAKWNGEFVLHRGGKTHYVGVDDWKAYYTDALLNRINEQDVFPEGGTGVHPVVWQYPPHVLRTITELTVPPGITGIGHDAFLNRANLTSVTIPSSVTYLDVSAFHGCSGLTNVTIPASVSSISDWVFAECSALTRVSIPASVSSIGVAAFQSCTSLTSVSLPVSIAQLGDYAFADCPSLTDVYYSGSEAQWKAIQMGEANSALTNAAIHYNHLMADVKTTDWFAQPVTWALENGVTAGTGNGNFSPGQDCTVAQILTFLWRANGSPKPAGSNPFSDVKDSDYYADAAAWAYEKGIISGGTFGGNTPCTRSMAVTYMWKAAGSPSAKTASFTDVPAGVDYASAVAWAVEQGVTAGTSATTFSPDNICTRGQIVTFLYRALAK